MHTINNLRRQYALSVHSPHKTRYAKPAKINIRAPKSSQKGLAEATTKTTLKHCPQQKPRGRGVPLLSSSKQPQNPKDSHTRQLKTKKPNQTQERGLKR